MSESDNRLEQVAVEILDLDSLLSKNIDRGPVVLLTICRLALARIAPVALAALPKNLADWPLGIPSRRGEEKP
jgi:hypothetical protein